MFRSPTNDSTPLIDITTISSSESTQINDTTKVFPIFNCNLNQTGKRSRLDMSITGEDESTSMSQRTVNELFEAILSNKNEIKEEIIKSKDEQVSSFNQLRNDVNEKIEAVSEKMDVIEARVCKSEQSIDDIKTKLNDIDQDKLATSMDITGISADDAKKNIKDPKTFAQSVISSFNITLDPNTIQRAYFREIKVRAMFILVVIFSSLEQKIDVMKRKREIKTNAGIYFDHSMTPHTRNLFMSARKFAKEKGLKSAFLSRGKVFISLDDNNKFKINSLEDLKKIDVQTNQNSLQIPRAPTSNGSAHGNNNK